jgi:hypothetical protein
MSDEKTMGRVIQIDEARSSAISIRSGTSCDYAVKCFGDPYGIGPLSAVGSSSGTQAINKI